MGLAIYACAVENIVTSMLTHPRTYGMFSSKQGNSKRTEDIRTRWLDISTDIRVTLLDQDHDIEDAI